MQGQLSWSWMGRKALCPTSGDFFFLFSKCYLFAMRVARTWSWCSNRILDSIKSEHGVAAGIKNSEELSGLHVAKNRIFNFSQPFLRKDLPFHIPELSEPVQSPWLADPEGCSFFPSPCFSFHGIISTQTCFCSWFKDGWHRPGVLGFLFSFGEMLRVSAPAFWSSPEISSDCMAHVLTLEPRPYLNQPGTTSGMREGIRFFWKNMGCGERGSYRNKICVLLSWERQEMYWTFNSIHIDKRPGLLNSELRHTYPGSRPQH